MAFPGGPAGTRPKSYSPEALRPWLSPGLPLPVFALAGTPRWLRSHVAGITAITCHTIIEALVRNVNISLIKGLIHSKPGRTFLIGHGFAVGNGNLKSGFSLESDGPSTA